MASPSRGDVDEGMPQPSMTTAGGANNEHGQPADFEQCKDAGKEEGGVQFRGWGGGGGGGGGKRGREAEWWWWWWWW